MTTFNSEPPSRHTRVTRRVQITEPAEALTWSRGRFTPTEMLLVHTKSDDSEWSVVLHIKGVRIKADGTPGANDATLVLVGMAGLPQYYRDYIDSHRPTD